MSIYASVQTDEGPSFLGIGAQKAGTTWLAKMLAMHPDIHIPVKEMHFWDTPPFTPARIEQYRGRFRGTRKLARGEITPKYAILPPETIDLIQSAIPSLRILYILRNPIERAWSHARMEYARQLFKLQRSPWDLSIDWFLTHFHSPESIARGDYAACLLNWQPRFPGDRIKLYIYEQDLRNPRTMLANCCQHLGVDAEFYSTVEEELLSVRVYPEKEQESIERAPLPTEVPPEFASILSSIYGDRIRHLSDMLGIDLVDLWLGPYPEP